MTDWMPQADRSPVQGGTMDGKPGRHVVWHTSESGNGPGAIRGVANWVKQQRSEYHLLWNPWTGEFLQLIAASQSARALKNDGGYRTNRQGQLRVQVCIVGRTADKPLAGGSPLKRWPELRAWLADLGIPEIGRTGSRSRALWEQPGHHRHADAPGNDHTDPGPIQFDLLFPQQQEPAPASRRSPGMITIKTPDSPLIYLAGVNGAAGIANPQDLREIQKALADPTHTAVVSGKTLDSIRNA